MPLFQDYSENGRLVSVRDEALNKENLDRYILEHGIDRAKGYHDAIKDVLKKIDQEILFFPWNNKLSPNTPAGIRRELTSFSSERHKFLSIFNEILTKSENSSSTEMNADAKLTP